jgi:hypothetical protein
VTSKLIGIIDPPCHRLKPIPDDELREGYEWMQRLSKDYGFKPGTIKSKATQSYTRTLTTGCIKAVNRHLDRECCLPASETYNAATGRSGDILGIVDAIVMEIDPPRNRWVQACGRDWQPHIAKMAGYDHVNRCRQILANPSHQLELWGWQQYAGFKSDGTRAKTKFWYPRVQVITMAFLHSKEPPQYVRFWEI